MILSLLLRDQLEQNSETYCTVAGLRDQKGEDKIAKGEVRYIFKVSELRSQ